MEKINIPATNYDWADYEDMKRGMTPEFQEWHKQQVITAIKEGKPVPEKVKAEYELV